MATDLSNWTKLEEKDVFQKTESHPYGDAADKKKQKININANKTTGDYSVFATGVKLGGLEGYGVGEDIPIYSFDNTNNRILITNKNYFSKMFKGSNGRNKVFKDLNKQLKIDILSIAKSKSNTTSERNNYIRLKNTEGYKSAANVIDTPPQTITEGPPDNSTTTKSSKSKSAVRSTNNAIRPIDMGDLSFFDFNLNVIVPLDDAVKDTATGAQYFRYPEGRIPQLGYDYIQITSYKYVPGLTLPPVPKKDDKKKTTPLSAESIAKDVFLRTNNKQTTSGRTLSQQAENIIQLPMIGGLSETTAVTWNTDTLSEINLIAGNIAYANITGGSNPVTAVTGALMDVIKTGKEALLDADTKTALMAYFAGQAASAPNFVQRATGKRINNNMELLFNGPNLRIFNFSFKLRPRTESESIVCRNIIKSLKRDSAPKTSTTNLFLETPNVFLLEYIYQAQDGIVPTYTQHPFMNMIKPCALTSINVNYTPDGSYMTYETNGSMVGYDLNLTFQEIEPIYRSDQEAEYNRDNMGY